MREEYRASFHVYMIGPSSTDSVRLHNILQDLKYPVLRFDSLSEAVSEISSCPPHFVILSEELPKRDHHSILATLVGLLPETHFLTLGKRTPEFPKPEFFDLGLEGHLDSGSSLAEIKRIFDQRSEADILRYSKEQLPNDEGVSFSDFSNACKSENPLGQFISKLHLKNHSDVLVYLRYFSARHVLAVLGGQGGGNLDGLGIDLNLDSNFKLESLLNPNQFPLVREFVKDTFSKDFFYAKPIIYQNEPIGILVLASGSSDCSKNFQDQWIEVLERIYSLQFMQARLQTLDQFCPETEALSLDGFSAEVKKEVARSRRLKLATSLVVLQVDHWSQLSAEMNSIQRKNWLRALYRFLIRHSRVNDYVGRISDGMFGVLLPHTKVEGAKVKADRLRALIESAELKVGGKVKKFTLSCGISEYPRIGSDAESLLQKAIDIVNKNESQQSNHNYVASFLSRESVDFDV